jgi:hypothetical protein
MQPATIEQVVEAVERVRERLLRSTAALEAAGIPYAVIGGNAVAAWITQVDEDAVRFTQDVDLMIRRDDLSATTAALAAAGFNYHEVLGIHVFLDGAKGNVRSGVHVLFAGEKVRGDYTQPAPDLTETAMEGQGRYRIVSLEALVRMKLTSFRLKDRVHLQDLIGVGLIDRSWLAQLPPELASRLQEVLNNPEG